MSTKKVVTVTLNPALDLTGSLSQLNRGAVSLVHEGSLHAAGKGVNVARVLADLGAEVTVTGFLGQENQSLFCQLFESINVTDRFIRVAGATRINVKLVEEDGEVSDINFPGVTVTATAIEQLEQTLFELAKTHDYFVIAGSLAQGISPAHCRDWIKRLRALGKKVLFDSSRDALKTGLAANPWLIKPNQDELAELLDTQLDTPEACRAAAIPLAQQGIENIVVSMGAAGVMWLNQDGWLQATPPKMPIISTVGAGDTLVAGLCWGDMQDMPKPKLLRFATALSALAVCQVGVGIMDLDALTEVENSTQIQPLGESAR